MDLAFALSVVLFAAAMCFTPGPNNTMALATGLSKGFRAALPLCIGATAGANITLILVYLGLGAMFDRFPVLYSALSVTGALYMLWLAWKISGLGNRRTGGAASEGNADFKPLTFFQGIFFQLINVKVWITNIVAVSAYIGAGAEKNTRFLFVFILFSVFGGSAIAMWAAGGAAMRRFLSSDAMRRCNYLFAAFLVLSIVLLFTTKHG